MLSDLKLVADQLARMTSPETEGAYGEQATANLAAFVNKFTGTVDAITTQYADTLATAHVSAPTSRVAT